MTAAGSPVRLGRVFSTDGATLSACTGILYTNTTICDLSRNLLNLMKFGCGFSFNSISWELFLACSLGFLAWIGMFMVSFNCYAYILYSLNLVMNFVCGQESLCGEMHKSMDIPHPSLL